MIHAEQNVPLNILLADDDKDDCGFFEDALNELSIQTNFKAVSDGERLMDYLSLNADNPPDILFLDINMPCKNGFECLTEVKQNEKLKRIPVVICSTSLGEDFAEKLYEKGAHYYMYKGDFSHLSKFIQMILNMLAEDPTQPPKNKFVVKLRKVKS